MLFIVQPVLKNIKLLRISDTVILARHAVFKMVIAARRTRVLNICNAE